MKNDSRFTGFTPATFQFFTDLEENNYKPWFDEHKYIYEQEVLQPLKALAVAMTPGMYSMDSQMDFRPQKMLSRIYRDIRFSADKTPYKSHMWVSFQRTFLDWKSFPGFYFEIGKEGAGYGMGLFAPKKKEMDRFREQIEFESERFKEITSGLIAPGDYQLMGEEYKRLLPNDLSEYFQPWMQRKSIYLAKNIPLQDKLFSADFVDYLLADFMRLQALYDFMVDVFE